VTQLTRQRDLKVSRPPSFRLLAPLQWCSPEEFIGGPPDSAIEPPPLKKYLSRQAGNLTLFPNGLHFLIGIRPLLFARNCFVRLSWARSRVFPRRIPLYTFFFFDVNFPLRLHNLVHSYSRPFLMKMRLCSVLPL